MIPFGNDFAIGVENLAPPWLIVTVDEGGGFGEGKVLEELRGFPVEIVHHRHSCGQSLRENGWGETLCERESNNGEESGEP